MSAPGPRNTAMHPVLRNPWARQLTIAGLGWLLFLFLLRVVWGQVAAVRLEGEIERLHAAGEPVRAADFAAESRDDQESVKVFNEAADLADYDVSTLHLPAVAPFTPREKMFIEDLVSANPHLFDLIHVGCVASRTRPATPLPNTTATRRYGARYGKIASMLCAKAILAHTDGDDRSSINGVLDLIALQQAAAAEDSGFFPKINAIHCSSHVVSAIVEITPNLQIGPSGKPDPATRPASRETVVQVVRNLIDVPAFASQSIRGAQLDRYAEVCAGPGREDFLPGVLAVVTRPIFTEGARARLKARTAIVAALQADQYPRAVALLDTAFEPSDGKGVSHVQGVASLEHDQPWESPHRWFQMQFWHRSERLMAGTALAIRLFRVDHDGQWPQSLKDLVPAYLPSVPMDLLSPDGSALEYLPPAPARHAALYGLYDSNGNKLAPPDTTDGVAIWNAWSSLHDKGAPTLVLDADPYFRVERHRMNGF